MGVGGRARFCYISSGRVRLDSLLETSSRVGCIARLRVVLHGFRLVETGTLQAPY